MQRVPSGDIEIDFKGVILAGIIETGCRNAIPVEANARHLGQFDAHQQGVPRNAPIKALVKVDHNAENNQRYNGTGYKEPPAYQEIGQDAQQRATEKNPYSCPTETIALAVQHAQAPL